MKSDYQYPLLQKLTSSLSSYKGDYSSVYIIACQHILESQAKMFELITEFGIPKKNIHIFGKIYSTNTEVLSEMNQNGFIVSQPDFNREVSFDEQHSVNCKQQFTYFLTSISSASKIIVLDDGGELLKIVHDSFHLIPSTTSVIGVEQTSSGFRKLENTKLKFPIFNVARSAIKLIQESPRIADLGVRRIIDVVISYSILEPRILVVGLGPMGSNVFSILKEKGYFIQGYDTAHHNKVELLELIMRDSINVVIGVTGSNILNEEQFQHIKDSITYNIYFISMSSADREFPTVYIRNHGTSPQSIHGDIVWEHITLVNNGFPVTFKGNRYESTPEEIEKTIGLLYGSVLESLVHEIPTPGFIDVPSHIVDVLT